MFLVFISTAILTEVFISVNFALHYNDYRDMTSLSSASKSSSSNRLLGSQQTDESSSLLVDENRRAHASEALAGNIANHLVESGSRKINLHFWDDLKKAHKNREFTISSQMVEADGWNKVDSGDLVLRQDGQEEEEEKEEEEQEEVVEEEKEKREEEEFLDYSTSDDDMLEYSGEEASGIGDGGDRRETEAQKLKGHGKGGSGKGGSGKVGSGERGSGKGSRWKSDDAEEEINMKREREMRNGIEMEIEEVAEELEAEKEKEEKEEEEEEDGYKDDYHKKMVLKPITGNYDKQKLQAMLKDHRREVEENAKCRVPSPEVVCMRSLNRNISRDYFPKCTIVFWCRGTSGCCAEGSACRVKTSSKIVRPFKEVIPFRGSVPSKIQLFEFTNHTECHCRRLSNFQTCVECPKTFKRRKRDDGRFECFCDPRSDDFAYCEGRIKGEIPVRKKDHRCILANRCCDPPCVNGSFDIRTGFCPCSQKDSEEKKQCQRLQKMILGSLNR